MHSWIRKARARSNHSVGVQGRRLMRRSRRLAIVSFALEAGRSEVSGGKAEIWRLPLRLPCRALRARPLRQARCLCL